jgi:hypothetical protein
MGMVNELSENEILDFLMTSDFNEGLNLDEFKFLLKKFRNFYRISTCNINNCKDRMDSALEESKNTKKECDQKVQIISNEKDHIEKKFNELLNKKLTWKERMYGKIIIENEIK